MTHDLIGGIMNGFQAGTSYGGLQVRGPNAVLVTIALILGATGFLIATVGQSFGSIVVGEDAPEKDQK